MIQPSFFERPARIANPRTVRAATQRRIVRKSRARYVGVSRVSMVLFCVLALLMGYVVLTSSLTGLSYAVAKARAQREALQEETPAPRRSNRRAAFGRSPGDLGGAFGHARAAHFAVVRIDPPRVVAQSRSHFAMLSSLAGFFAPAVSHRQ